MRQTIFILLFSALGAAGLWAQSDGSYFGVKGGPTIAIQQWNTFDRNPLFGYHAVVFVESLPEREQFSLYAQLGYHLKGSSIRRSLFGNPFNAGAFSLPPQNFKFHNLSLVLGAKQRFTDLGGSRVFYNFGIRGDYTLDTNLDEYNNYVEANPTFAGIYPIDSYDFIRRINYGITVGGGFEFPFSEYVEGLLEFTVNPDFSLQYQQPAIPNVIDPFTGNTRTIPERRIRNLTFEVTLGFRFLRKVEYVN